MKQFWICLLALLLLAGCGAEEPADQAPDGELSPEASTTVPTEGPVTLELEWETYAPSVEQVWYVVENTGTETVEFGEDYHLEMLGEDGAWYDVPWRENAAVNTIAYILQPGEKHAGTCSFSQFDYDFSGGGTFRVIKVVGDQTLTAEFTLGEGAAISAETPYGFGPMEDVPEHGDPAELATTGAVVFTEAGVENADAAETFLEKVSLGIPCQLRTLQNYYESWPMLIDVIYDGSSFFWRMRTGGEITEKRFSYIVTDGTDVYLSNGADWDSTERYDSDKAFLLPSGSGSALVPKAQEMMEDQTAGNITRYRIWSADGVWDAALTGNAAEFSVGWEKPGEGSGGSLHSIRSWYDDALSIKGISWQADGTLRLTCETAGGGARTFDFDPETEDLTEALCGYPTAN